MPSFSKTSPSAMNQGVPFGPRAIAVLCIFYALLGVTGHDPWKNADAINLAIAFDFHRGANSGVALPTLAGEPWLITPPLYHWLAAQIGNALRSWLSWHDGARLTSAMFTLVGLFLISLAARGFHGRDASHIAPLLAVGSLGLLIPTHDAQPALIGFAAIAGVLAALAWWQVNPTRSAIGLGFSTGIGFLGCGLQSLVLTTSAIVVALCFADWRRVSRRSWLIALMIAGPILMAWPLVMYQISPNHLIGWLESDIHRIVGEPLRDLKRFELLLWATWPALPLAAWATWLHRKQLLLGRHLLPLVTGVLAMALFFFMDDATEAIPALVASLAVIGSSAAGRLRRGAANALDWFGAITLTLFMGLIWLAGYSILTGEPARIAKNFTKPAIGFQPEISWMAIGMAITATLFWIYLLATTPRSPWRASARWAAGTVCIWVLIVCLMMPWINHTKSYRQVAQALAAHIGDSSDCIERSGLGSAQRASLFYFSGIKTIPVRESTECPLRIVQAGAGSPSALTNWTLQKEFFRPGDRRERLRLYRRNP